MLAKPSLDELLELRALVRVVDPAVPSYRWSPRPQKYGYNTQVISSLKSLLEEANERALVLRLVEVNLRNRQVTQHSACLRLLGRARLIVVQVRHNADIVFFISLRIKTSACGITPLEGHIECLVVLGLLDGIVLVLDHLVCCRLDATHVLFCQSFWTSVVRSRKRSMVMVKLSMYAVVTDQRISIYSFWMSDGYASLAEDKAP